MNKFEAITCTCMLFYFHYAGIQGFNMYIDEHGDVESNYTVLAVKDDEHAIETFGKSLQPVGYFQATNEEIPVSFDKIGRKHDYNFDIIIKIMTALLFFV